MKKVILALCLAISLLATPHISFAWGAKGHQLVAEIAYHYLDVATREALMHYLKKTTIEDAATWMDENRSNSFYNYMRPWHYIDIEKDSLYDVKTTERNMITVLNSAIYALKHREDLSDKKIKEHLFYIFHLVGDLHQPLHTGYPNDRGGNDIIISGPNYGGNLHSFWDTEMIEAQKVTLDDCIKMQDSFSSDEIKKFQKISIMKWMYESRSLLDNVYNFKNGKVDKAYVDTNIVVVKKQLFIGGLRLAIILQDIFTTAPYKK